MAIHSFEGFSISFPVIVAAGTIIALAIINIGSFFQGLVVGQMGVAVEASQAQMLTMIRSGAFANLPVLVVGIYISGKWVSWRCARNGVLAVALIVFLAETITRLFDFMMLTQNEWEGIFESKKTAINMIL